jgi:hypothetical protein
MLLHFHVLYCVQHDTSNIRNCEQIMICDLYERNFSDILLKKLWKIRQRNFEPCKTTLTIWEE